MKRTMLVIAMLCALSATAAAQRIEVSLINSTKAHPIRIADSKGELARIAKPGGSTAFEYYSFGGDKNFTIAVYTQRQLVTAYSYEKMDYRLRDQRVMGECYITPDWLRSHGALGPPKEILKKRIECAKKKLKGTLEEKPLTKDLEEFWKMAEKYGVFHEEEMLLGDPVQTLSAVMTVYYDPYRRKRVAIFNVRQQGVRSNFSVDTHTSFGVAGGGGGGRGKWITYGYSVP